MQITRKEISSPMRDEPINVQQQQRSMKDWFEKILPGKKWIRNLTVHRMLGEQIFAREVWHITRRSIAGGLALGLFIAFTPTIPVQMLLAAVCAIKLQVNLPIALLGCWTTNPVTAIPLYHLAFKLGRYVLEDAALLIIGADLATAGAFPQLLIRASYLWTGGVIMGAGAAAAGYFTIQAAWRVAELRTWHNNSRKRPSSSNKEI